MTKIERKEIIKSILSSLSKNVLIVSSLGLISRELFNQKDSPQNFYVTGSMGIASSIGLGIALVKPQLKVVVIDGDGSILMNLGSLANIGNLRPKNLIHIVIDNEAYNSCSGEPSISKTAKLHETAKIVGYKNVKKTQEKNIFEKELKESLRGSNGSTFILIKSKKGGCRKLPRILELEMMTTKFKKFIQSIE